MIYLATNQGVAVVVSGHDWRVGRWALQGKNITCISSDGVQILAGTAEGIYRSHDSGMTWQKADPGPAHPHIRWVAHHPDEQGLFLAGTEPAAISITKDGGETWADVPEVPRLRDQFHWFLPYSPESGCVRGFAMHGSRAYAAVEVGGVLRSENHGASWALAEGSDGHPASIGTDGPKVHPDVHSILVHTTSAERVLTATGGGFYQSTDGGATWRRLYSCYCRAAWVDDNDPEHMILGPADGVSRNGRIEESSDGGKTWQPASQGLDTPWAHTMVERFTQVDDQLLAVLSNGQLAVAPLDTMKWHFVLEDGLKVHALHTA